MSYKFLEHTSDIGVEVISKDLQTAFIESSFALYDIIFGSFTKGNSTKKNYKINVIGNDLESLFINFLNELIFIFDAEKVICDINNLVILDNDKLEITCSKRKIKSLKIPIKLYVKAVTFHQFKIITIDKKVIINYFVDI